MRNSTGERRRRWLPATLIATGVSIVAVGAAPGTGASPAQAGDLPTPIQHVVIVYQENHSFDNVLGALCVQQQRCDGAVTGTRADGTVMPLTTAPDIVPVANHTTSDQVRAINAGGMDGFTTNKACDSAHGFACMSQYQPSQIPSLAAMATSNVIFDRFFELNQIPSWGSHMELVSMTLDNFVAATNPVYRSGAGQPASGAGWGCDSNKDAQWKDPTTGTIQWVPACVPAPDGGGSYKQTPVQNVPTLFDRLDQAGEAWKLYTQNYKWAICPTFAECLNSPQAKNMVKTSTFVNDATNGALPAFSIVLPDGATGKTSQHNGTSMMQGDNFLAGVVNAVQNGPDWNSTAIFITYDDCGCFYDHVAPPPGLGIRLPAVMVSPYAKPSYTDHNVASIASILAFTEYVLGLAPLTDADANAYNLTDAFDFTQSPLPAQPLTKTAVPKSSLRYLATSPAKADDT